MALVGTDRGFGSRAIGAESNYVINPGSNFTSGSIAVLCVAYDNTATNGADAYTSIVDSLGNTWTSRVNSINNPTLIINQGVVLRIFTAVMTSPLTTANTITITFNSTTTHRAYALHEIKSDAGFSVVYSTGNNAVITGTAMTITSSSLSVGSAIIGASGGEWGGDETFTPDADTTNGSWTTHMNSATGSGAGGAGITSQRKIVTGVGAQTYNVTLGLSADACVGWISLIELATEPVTQASGLTVVSKTDSSITFNLASIGSGSKCKVFAIRAESVTPTPVDNTVYTASGTFMSGSQIGSSGWYAVAELSVAGQFTVSGLLAETSYTFMAVSYNGSGGAENYFTPTSTDNPIAAFTAASEPIDQALGLNVQAAENSVQITECFRGSGVAVKICIKAGNSGVPPLVDGVGYVGSATFGTVAIGGGWFACDTINTVGLPGYEVSGLASDTEYIMFIAEYNGDEEVGTVNYLLSAGTNSAVFTTVSSVDTAPTFVIASVVDFHNIDVTFNQAMGTGVLTPDNYTLSGPGLGSFNEHPASVVNTGGNTYRLTWPDQQSMESAQNLTILAENMLTDGGTPIAANTTASCSACSLSPRDPGVSIPVTNLSIGRRGAWRTVSGKIINVANNGDEYGPGVSGFEDHEVVLEFDSAGLAEVELPFISGFLLSACYVPAAAPYQPTQPFDALLSSRFGRLAGGSLLSFNSTGMTTSTTVLLGAGSRLCGSFNVKVTGNSADVGKRVIVAFAITQSFRLIPN